jgi:predicted metal-dependent phosphotriesterase family hydrolase
VNRDEDALAAIFVHEIENGIQGTCRTVDEVSVREGHPVLKDRGMTNAQLDRRMVENPKRWLGS